MPQKMVNGSKHDGSVTRTHRMTNRYAVVGAPKPFEYNEKRKEHWKQRNKKK